VTVSALGSGTTVFTSGVTGTYCFFCGFLAYSVLVDFLCDFESDDFFFGKDLPFIV
jgi:hypothetical protein